MAETREQIIKRLDAENKDLSSKNAVHREELSHLDLALGAALKDAHNAKRQAWLCGWLGFLAGACLGSGLVACFIVVCP